MMFDYSLQSLHLLGEQAESLHTKLTSGFQNWSNSFHLSIFFWPSFLFNLDACHTIALRTKQKLPDIFWCQMAGLYRFICTGWGLRNLEIELCMHTNLISF